jgi:hypothetical protein
MMSKELVFVVKDKVRFEKVRKMEKVAKSAKIEEIPKNLRKILTKP